MIPIDDSSNDNIIIVRPDEMDFFKNFVANYNIRWSGEDKKNMILPLSKSYVGYITTPSRKILLEPKYSEIGFEQIIRIYLYVYGFRSNDSPSILDISNFDSNIDVGDVFLKCLKSNIHEGILRSYSMKAERIDSFKGKVNYTKTLIASMNNESQYVYSRHPVLQVENDFNDLILSALHKLMRVKKYSSSASELSMYFVGANGSVKSGSEILKKITFNSNTMRYKQTLSYAAMIIDNLFFGLENSAFGADSFIINFDRLFEDFIDKILINVPDEKEFSIWPREKKFGDIVSQTGMYDQRFYLPDILYRFNDENILYNFEPSAFGTIDVKNKAYYQYKNADVYQILTYSQILHSKKAVLIYPSFTTRRPETLYINSDSIFPSEVFSCFININSNRGIDFLQSIKSFVKDLLKILNSN